MHLALIRKSHRDGVRTEIAGVYAVWRPCKAFDSDFRGSGRMDFGQALAAMKSGRKVTRAAWGSEGMWLKHVPDKQCFEIFSTEIMMPYKWVPAQGDLLADDWEILENG
jgi:hypothetical protein